VNLTSALRLVVVAGACAGLALSGAILTGLVDESQQIAIVLLLSSLILVGLVGIWRSGSASSGFLPRLSNKRGVRAIGFVAFMALFGYVIRGMGAAIFVSTMSVISLMISRSITKRMEK